MKKFSEKKPTIGYEEVKYETKVTDSTVSKLSVWDTAGHSCMSLPDQFYREAHAAIVCFNLTDRQSFKNVDAWAKHLDKQFEGQEIVKCLVGLQSDLVQDNNSECDNPLLEHKNVCSIYSKYSEVS